MTRAEAIDRPVDAEVQSEIATLVEEIGVRLLNGSPSGCLLETKRPVTLGTVATLHLSFGGRTFSDLVRVVRCQTVDRQRDVYEVAAHFLPATPPFSGSVRQVMRRDYRELAEWISTEDDR